MNAPPFSDFYLNEQQKACLDQFLQAFPSTSSDVALKFCRARKWDAQRAISLRHNYLGSIKKYALGDQQDLFMGIGNGMSLVDLLNTGLIYLPGSRAIDASTILIVEAGHLTSGPHGTLLSTNSILRLAFWVGEMAVTQEQTQLYGLTLIIDLHDVSFADFDAQSITNLANFFQNSMPCSVKSILLLRAPWWITVAVNLVLPFLSAKMRNRVHLIDSLQALKTEGGVELCAVPKRIGGSMSFDLGLWVKEQAEHISLTMNLERVAFDKTGFTSLSSASFHDWLAREQKKAQEDLKNRTKHQICSIEDDLNQRIAQLSLISNDIKHKQLSIDSFSTTIKDTRVVPLFDILRNKQKRIYFPMDLVLVLIALTIEEPEETLQVQPEIIKSSSLRSSPGALSKAKATEFFDFEKAERELEEMRLKEQEIQTRGKRTSLPR